LLGAIYFLYESCFFEGFSINREFFSLVGIMLSWKIYLADVGPRGLRLFLAGMAAGSSLWIKEQALFLTWAIPIEIIFRARTKQPRELGLSPLALYVAGGFAMCLLMAMPMILRGTFHEQWNWLIGVESAYALNRHEAVSPDLFFYAKHMYLDIPFRRLLGIAFIGFLFVTLRLTHRLFKKGTGSEPRPSLIRKFGSREVPVSHFQDASSSFFRNNGVPPIPAIVSLAAWSLPLSMFVFQLGSRMFLHYFLFALPSISILLAFVLSECLSSRTSISSRLLLVLAIALLWVIDDSLLAQPYPEHIWASTDAFRTFVFLSTMILTLLVTWAWATGRKVAGALLLSAVVVGMIVAIEMFTLFRVIHRDPWYAIVRGSSLQSFREASVELARRTTPQDRVFIWGCRPELYFYSKRSAASSFVTSVDILADPNPSIQFNPKYNLEYVSEMLRELESTKPRYIVDSWLISLYGVNFLLQDCEPVAHYINKHYLFDGESYGCMFFRRREDPLMDPAVSVIPSIDQSLESLDNLLIQHMEDPMLRLTKADILVRVGRMEEAVRIYQGIKLSYPTWDPVNDRLERIADGSMFNDRELPWSSSTPDSN
jgi:hypothetical protein